MVPLKTDATLADIQEYVAEMKIERGFSTENRIYECFMLGEEVGELFKAVRRSEGWTVSDPEKPANVAEELADCLIYLASIANQHGINLETAFRDKEAINATRTWKKATQTVEKTHA